VRADQNDLGSCLAAAGHDAGVTSNRILSIGLRVTQSWLPDKQPRLDTCSNWLMCTGVRFFLDLQPRAACYILELLSSRARRPSAWEMPGR
jgi:hypothetical protein